MLYGRHPIQPRGERQVRGASYEVTLDCRAPRKTIVNWRSVYDPFFDFTRHRAHIESSSVQWLNTRVYKPDIGGTSVSNRSP